MSFVIEDDDALDDYNEIWDQRKVVKRKISQYACL